MTTVVPDAHIHGRTLASRGRVFWTLCVSEVRGIPSFVLVFFFVLMFAEKFKFRRSYSIAGKRNKIRAACQPNPSKEEQPRTQPPHRGSINRAGSEMR
ncbi:hypothetical protein DL93DRAFT_1754416 [Clavulina sp. PMI_390]|nr:hypothetical protein DL93DRAFT_1754416 [Clavulina sp. PMI_390]